MEKWASLVDHPARQEVKCKPWCFVDQVENMEDRTANNQYRFWLVAYLRLRKILVSWDHYFPIYGKIKNVPNHKPDKYRFVYDDLVHLEKYEAATVDWTFPILTYMVTKHSILPDVQLHWEGKYRRIEYDAFGNSWVPYFLWAYQYSTSPRYAMTFPDTDPNLASVLLPQIGLEWFRPIQAISNDPIYEVVWLVDSWGKHSATYEYLWYPTSRSESLYPPQSHHLSIHAKRQLLRWNMVKPLKPQVS